METKYSAGISRNPPVVIARRRAIPTGWMILDTAISDRKSTRLNSSHPSISYAVFCLKKKTNSSGECEGAQAAVGVESGSGSMFEDKFGRALGNRSVVSDRLLRPVLEKGPLAVTRNYM